MPRIHSNRTFINGALQNATILIKDGYIVDVFEGLAEGSGFIDVGDNVLMPGVIDIHVHVNEPGRTDWEGFETATQAAAAGGITTLVDMPLNSSPVTVDEADFMDKLAASKNKMNVNCGFWGGLIPGNFKNLEPLLESGVLGLKAFLIHSGIDEFPNANLVDIDKAMPILVKHDKPLLVHCEWHQAHKGEELLLLDPTSYEAYLNSRPKSWENEAIQKVIEFCRKHHCKTHIVHVSSAEAIDMIKSAKKEGLPLSAETCPHYILFDAEHIQDGQTLLKCAPPIREAENNLRLKQALKTDVLDFIASDHSPSPPNLKGIESGNFANSWGGIAGIQQLLSASWTALKEDLKLEMFISKLTHNPAAFLSLNEKIGKIKVGYKADLTVWSPEKKFLLKKEDLFQKHKISPYVGKELFGKVLYTFVSGRLVYDGKKIKTKHQGQWILKK